MRNRLEHAGAHPRKDPGPIALRVTQLGLPAALDGIDVDVARGEVVGIAGLRGSGASDLLHALFGSHARTPTGQVELDGAPYMIRTPRESVARGLVLLAGDRQAALVPDLGVIQNATLAGLDRFLRGPLLDRAAERRATEEMATRFHLRAPSLDAPVRALSGGNQQKVLIARSALAAPKVLLLDDPTRGVDIAARGDIYRAIRLWADAGVAVLLVTSDTEELVELADRIVVLYRGKVAKTFDQRATREQVVAAAVGGAA